MSCISLLPFFLIFSFVLFFQKVGSALFAGIISIFAIKIFVYKQSLQAVLIELLKICKIIVSTRDYIYPLLFFSTVILIVELLRYSGVMHQYCEWMRKKISSGVELECATLLLAPFAFVDDYLSSLSLGAFVQPLLGHYHIARVKFAYLIESSSASLSALIPVSSWGIMVLGQLRNILGTEVFLQGVQGVSPTHTILFSIPFLLYPLASYFFAWYVVVKRISFGPMREYEQQATQGEFLAGEDKETLYKAKTGQSKQHKWIFFVPFITFFSVLLLHFVKTYNLCASLNSHFLEIVEQTDLAFAMVHGIIWGLGALLLAMMFARLLTKKVLHSSFCGLIASTKSAITVLVLAWILGALLKTIGTLHLFSSACQCITVTSWYPLIFFVISFLTCMAMGSAWGTIALVMPLLSCLGVSTEILFYTSLASLLSGAIAGSHFTPISDVMIMSSTSAGCKVIDHFRSHAYYALMPLIGTLVGLIFIGIAMPYLSYAKLAIFSIIISLRTTLVMVRLYLRKGIAPLYSPYSF